MRRRVYTYVMVVDGGSAPNYDGPFVTLAICKPFIRKGAEKGDLVVAFTGKRLGPEPHAVRWAGVVSEKLPFEKYWKDDRFADKKPGRSLTPDNIYKLGQAGLVQVNNPIHEGHDEPTDLRGQYVLVFDKVWSFRDVSPVLPPRFKIRMEKSRRGHRVFDLPPARSEQLMRWLGDQQCSWQPASGTPTRKCSCRRATGTTPC